MNGLFRFFGGVIGLAVVIGGSYLATGWTDPFFRPMDILKVAVGPKKIRIVYPDVITIDQSFAETLLNHRSGEAIQKKKSQFVNHLNDVGTYVVTPADPTVFRAIVVANEGRGVLSFTVYLRVLIDAAESEVAYRMSSFIEQFPTGPSVIERVERQSKKKIIVDTKQFHQLNPSLWDLAIYAAVEFGPCCK